MPTIQSLTCTDGSTVAYPLVTLRLVATDADEVAFSNDGATWSPWQAYSGNLYEWLLLSGDGVRLVRVKVRNASLVEATGQVAITLDTKDDTDGLLGNLPALYSRRRAGLLYELFGACATEMALFRAALVKAREQLNIQRARETWLNLWGRKLGVSRRSGETDTDYAPRLIDRLTDPKLSPEAVRQALEDELGSTVSVSEPSAFNGYLIIQVVGPVSDMDALWRRLREVKACGVKAVVVVN